VHFCRGPRGRAGLGKNLGRRKNDGRFRIFKPIAISDRGGEDNDQDNGGGSNDSGGKDNNHQSRMNTDSSRGMGTDNMPQDRVASLTVHNIVPPPEDDGIRGYQLPYLR